jgi:hypothetical protein
MCPTIWKVLLGELAVTIDETVQHVEEALQRHKKNTFHFHLLTLLVDQYIIFWQSGGAPQQNIDF